MFRDKTDCHFLHRQVIQVPVAILSLAVVETHVLLQGILLATTEGFTAAAGAGQLETHLGQQQVDLVRKELSAFGSTHNDWRSYDHVSC